MPSDHTLSPDDHDAKQHALSRQYLQLCSTSDNPRAIIFAGQPGAGKGSLKQLAEAQLETKAVDTDELRYKHPSYRRLLADGSRKAASAVQKDAGAWADGLVRDLSESRRNIVIDGTLKTPENATRLVRDLKDKGYEVEIQALAVAKEDSITSVYGRYGTSGRWVPEKVHREAYHGIPKSIAALEAQGIVDKLEVYRRAAEGGPPERIHSGPGAADALQRERNREPTREQLEARSLKWNREGGIMDQIRTQDPKLSEPDNQRAMILAKEALEKCERSKEKNAKQSPWQTYSEQTKSRGKVSMEKSGKEK